MRRLPLSLLASCGLLLLAACSGGSGFGTNSSNSPDALVFAGSSGQVNDFFVSPSGNQPVQINVTAVKGSGPAAVILPGHSFTWAAAFAAPGTTYTKGASPVGTGTCGTPAVTPTVDSLLQQGAGGNAYPLFGGAYTQLSGTLVSTTTQGMQINYTQQASNIFVGPPTTTIDATGNATGTVVTPSATSLTASYCLRLVATDVPSGRQGSIVVVVSNSP